LGCIHLPYTYPPSTLDAPDVTCKGESTWDTYPATTLDPPQSRPRVIQVANTCEIVGVVRIYSDLYVLSIRIAALGSRPHRIPHRPHPTYPATTLDPPQSRPRVIQVANTCEIVGVVRIYSDLYVLSIRIAALGSRPHRIPHRPHPTYPATTLDPPQSRPRVIQVANTCEIVGVVRIYSDLYVLSIRIAALGSRPHRIPHRPQPSRPPTPP